MTAPSGIPTREQVEVLASAEWLREVEAYRLQLAAAQERAMFSDFARGFAFRQLARRCGKIHLRDTARAAFRAYISEFPLPELVS